MAKDVEHTVTVGDYGIEIKIVDNDENMIYIIGIGRQTHIVDYNLGLMLQCAEEEE